MTSMASAHGMHDTLPRHASLEQRTMQLQATAYALEPSSSAIADVLLNPILLRLVTNCMAGYPFAVVRLCALPQHKMAIHKLRAASPDGLGRMSERGVLPHLAILAGDSDTLTLLHALANHPHYRDDPQLCFARTMHCAVRFSCTQMLSCIQALTMRDADAPWEPYLMTAAFTNGRVDIPTLEWLHAHLPAAMRVPPASMVAVLAVHNDLPVFQWLCEHGYDIPLEAVERAADNRHTALLAYLYKHSNKRCGRWSLHGAAVNGALEIVKLIVEHQTEAAKRAALTTAARNGHVDIVQFFVESALVTDTSRVFDEAARGGSLSVVLYLHRHLPVTGCTTRAMDEAAINGHLEVVKFLHEHRSEGCTTLAMDDAACRGHLSIVEFLHAHRGEGCTSRAMDTAAACGHLDVVKFLHTHRSEGCTTFALAHATRSGHIDVMRFLCAHRPECDIPSALADAAAAGSLELVKLLHERLREGESSYLAAKAAALPLKPVIVRYLCEHQTNKSTGLLHQAIVDGAAWVVQAVSMYAPMDELLDAKQVAQTIAAAEGSLQQQKQKKSRLVAVLDRQIRALHTRGVGVIV